MTTLILCLALTGQCSAAGCSAPQAAYYVAAPAVTFYQAPTAYTVAVTTRTTVFAAPGRPVRRVIGRLLHPFRR